MTSVCVYSYTHSVAYVADNILKSLKNIVRLSGLNPDKLVNGWESYLRALSTWLHSQHLERVVLEIFNPSTDKLALLWELEIAYAWTSEDGAFWTDTDQLRYHILKAGVLPSQADYRLLLYTKAGEPAVDGWGKGTARSSEGMVKQSLGSTVSHSGLAANGGYWRHP